MEKDLSYSRRGLMPIPDDFSKSLIDSHPEIKSASKLHSYSEISNFEKFIDINDEFEILEEITSSDKHKKKITGEDKDVVDQNRYNNILPFRGTIVPIIDEICKDAANPKNYINACSITNPNTGRMNELIATQGPITKSLTNFWRMIWC